MVNVVCSVGLWSRYRDLAHSAPALLVRGKLQNAEGAVTVVAERLQRMNLRVGTRSGTGTEVGTVPRSGPNK